MNFKLRLGSYGYDVKQQERKGFLVGKNDYFKSIFEIKGYKTIHCAIILRSDSHTQTLPHRGRTLNNPAKNPSNQQQSTISKSQSQIRQRSVSENRNGSSVEEDIVIYRLPGEKLGLGLRFGFLRVQSFQVKQARKGFRPPCVIKGIGYIQNLRNFLRNVSEIFGFFWGFFWDFIQEAFWRNYLCFYKNVKTITFITSD